MAETVTIYCFYVCAVSFIVATTLRLPIKKFFFYCFFTKIAITSLLFVLPDKLAAKELIEVKSRGLSHNFSLYYYASFPIFEVTGNARAAFVSVSTLVSFWCSLLIAHKPYIKNNKIIFLLLNFYPDLLYFNAFSLRDIMIVFVQCLFILSLFEHIFHKEKYSFIMIISYSFLLMLLRDEVLIWCLASYLIFLLAKYTSVNKFVSIIILSPFLIYIFADYVISYILRILRLTNSVFTNYMDAIFHVINSRYYRQFSDSDQSGTTTAILSPNQFENIAPELYLLLSLFTALVVTYWKNGFLVNVTRLTYVIALGNALRPSLKTMRVSKLWLLFFIVAVLSYLIYAPLIVNGGNAFRMRLTSIALLLILPNIDFGWRHNENE